MEIVNGFRCKNCTDVDYAKKHIDPAHPKDGPYGVNAKTNPERAGEISNAGASSDPAVVFAGSLSFLNRPGRVSGVPSADAVTASAPRTSAGLLDLSV